MLFACCEALDCCLENALLVWAVQQSNSCTWVSCRAKSRMSPLRNICTCLQEMWGQAMQGRRRAHRLQASILRAALQQPFYQDLGRAVCESCGVRVGPAAPIPPAGAGRGVSDGAAGGEAAGPTGLAVAIAEDAADATGWPPQFQQGAGHPGQQQQLLNAQLQNGEQQNKQGQQQEQQQDEQQQDGAEQQLQQQQDVHEQFMEQEQEHHQRGQLQVQEQEREQQGPGQPMVVETCKQEVGEAGVAGTGPAAPAPQAISEDRSRESIEIIEISSSSSSSGNEENARKQGELLGPVKPQPQVQPQPQAGQRRSLRSRATKGQASGSLSAGQKAALGSSSTFSQHRGCPPALKTDVQGSGQAQGSKALVVQTERAAYQRTQQPLSQPQAQPTGQLQAGAHEVPGQASPAEQGKTLTAAVARECPLFVEVRVQSVAAVRSQWPDQEPARPGQLPAAGLTPAPGSAPRNPSAYRGGCGAGAAVAAAPSAAGGSTGAGAAGSGAGEGAGGQPGALLPSLPKGALADGQASGAHGSSPPDSCGHLKPSPRSCMRSTLHGAHRNSAGLEEDGSGVRARGSARAAGNRAQSEADAGDEDEETETEDWAQQGTTAGPATPVGPGASHQGMPCAAGPEPSQPSGQQQATPGQQQQHQLLLPPPGQQQEPTLSQPQQQRHGPKRKRGRGRSMLSQAKGRVSKTKAPRLEVVCVQQHPSQKGGMVFNHLPQVGSFLALPQLMPLASTPLTCESLFNSTLRMPLAQPDHPLPLSLHVCIYMQLVLGDTYARMTLVPKSGHLQCWLGLPGVKTVSKDNVEVSGDQGSFGPPSFALPAPPACIHMPSLQELQNQPASDSLHPCSLSCTGAPQVPAQRGSGGAQVLPEPLHLGHRAVGVF